MELLTKLAEKIQHLSPKEFQKYFTIFFVAILGAILGLVYYIYAESTELVASMKKIESLSGKSIALINKFERIQSEEDQIMALIEKNKDFDLREYFETFYKSQGLNPEGGWGTTANVLNPEFDEIELSASFKGQTTEKLVKILQELDKQKIVYVKELRMKADKNKTIIVDITIATLRKK
ncbi:MAG: hypothetical protein V1855_00550 [bacterium]